MKVKADVLEFSHHNVYIPEHLKIMIDQEVEKSAYKNVNSWLNAKYKGDWSITAIKQVISGKTKTPSVDLLEDIRRMLTKVGVASKHNYPQLPLIRTSEIRRIVNQDKGLSYKFIAAKIGTDSATISNTINDKVLYRYLTAWSLTHFFINYFDNPWHNRQPVTWDFYAWVQERRAEEGILTQEELSRWRDQYNRRTGITSYYLKKG